MTENKFKIGDMVAHTGPHFYGELTAGHVYEVSGIIPNSYGGPSDRLLLAGVPDSMNTGWLASRFTLNIRAQDERDDWWTARIDPYDDRIRELERFKHRAEDVGDVEDGRDDEIARLRVENKNLTDTNLRFAGLITEQRARLKAVEHCLTTPIQQHQPGEQNGSNQAVRELQQGSPLQASANGGAHLLP